MAYTTIDKPTDYFTSFLWTGDGSTSPRSHTGVGLQADMMWSKVRSAGHQHNLVDTVRGVNQRLLMPSDNGDEDTTCTHGHFDSLDSDGFTTTNAGGNWNVNASSQTYVGWFWKAGGSASSNSNGSITSSVSANTTVGFSIVSYTSTGSNATVGHGLGAVPSMIIFKRRSGDTENWPVYHKSLGATKNIKLNLTDAVSTSSTRFNDTEPTSSVFSLGTSGDTNGGTSPFIAYCFAEKKGYSKFGSYTGNGNADGTFVYTGFKPAFIIFKSTSATGAWQIYDSTRERFNDGTQPALKANGNDAEFTKNVDILSNGVKLRDTTSDANASGVTYIYMAFAEAPFVTSTGIPTTAR